MKITKTSIISSRSHTLEINITLEQLKQLIKGENVMKVCPELSPDDREFLMSGITPTEWKELFARRNEGCL